MQRAHAESTAGSEGRRAHQYPDTGWYSLSEAELSAPQSNAGSSYAHSPSAPRARGSPGTATGAGPHVCARACVCAHACARVSIRKYSNEVVETPWGESAASVTEGHPLLSWPWPGEGAVCRGKAVAKGGGVRRPTCIADGHIPARCVQLACAARCGRLSRGPSPCAPRQTQSRRLSDTAQTPC